MNKLSFFIITLLFFFASCGEDDLIIDARKHSIPDVILDQYADWMQILINEYDDEVSLSSISIPSAHDAGTYLFKFCSDGANDCNTKTQDLNMTKMLEAGVRSFDIRPVLTNNKYFTQHVTGCGGMGCRGDFINSILEQTKSYLDNHAELVILTFTHFCNTGADDADLMEMVYSILGDRLFIDDGNQTVKFKDRPLKEIVSSSEMKGKVIILFDGVSNTEENRANGIFSHAYLSISGSYANTHNFEEMKTNQLMKFGNFNPNGNSIFETSWTLTQNTELAVACAFTIFNPTSIEDLANKANEKLKETINEMITDGSIVKGKIPNIIALDFADKFVTDECIRLSILNLE